MKKVFTGFIVIALLFAPSFAPAQAMTRAETDALIQQLLVQVMQLQQRLLLLLQERSGGASDDVDDMGGGQIAAYRLPNTNLSSPGEKGDLETSAVAYLNWTAVYGARGYNLYRSTDPSVSLNDARTVSIAFGTTLTTYAETYIRGGKNVLAPGRYYYRVVPLSPYGEIYNGSSNVLGLSVPAARSYAYQPPSITSLSANYTNGSILLAFGGTDGKNKGYFTEAYWRVRFSCPEGVILMGKAEDYCRNVNTPFSGLPHLGYDKVVTDYTISVQNTTESDRLVGATLYLLSGDNGEVLDSRSITITVRAPITSGSIDVLTPAPNTLVFAGSSMTIRWEAKGIAKQGDGVSLLYRSTEEPLFHSITQVKVENTGIYSWSIPSTMHWGEYRLQVCISGGAMPPNQRQICSKEMPFSITQGSWSMGAPIAINTPVSENELWQRGTWKDITWNDAGAPAGTRYDISISDYSGGKGETIVRGASASAGKGMIGWYVGSGASLVDMSHPNPNNFGPGPWYVKVNRSGETINTMSPGSFYLTEYCSQPAFISDLRAVYDGSKVTLSWSPVQCALGWNVYRSTDPSVPMGVSSTETLIVNLSPSKGSGTGFVDSASWDVSMGISPLSAGQTYYYKVVPLGTPAGNNSSSNVASITI